MTREEATLRAWPVWPAQIERLVRFGDVLVGVFRGQVVTVFDIKNWRRETPAERAAAAQTWSRSGPERVIFDGVPSKRWAHLAGRPSPGRRMTGWPVQYVDTPAL